MPMTSKEPLSGSPPIDELEEYDPSPDYANYVLDQATRWYTLNQISAHTGISRRLLSYMRHRGINNYANQIALEIMAGVRVLEE